MEHFAQIVKFHNYQVIIELSINVTRPNLMYHKYGPTLIDTIVTHTHTSCCVREMLKFQMIMRIITSLPKHKKYACALSLFDCV